MGWRAVGIVVLLAALGSVGLAREVSAQEAPPAGTMGIWFPDPSEEGQDGPTLQDYVGGSVAVFADGILCGSFDVVEPILIIVGSVDQPGACRVEGAVVEFANGHGHMFFVTTRFESDATVGILNFAPWVPHIEYPAYACDYFASAGIAAVQCQMTGPSGVAPGGVGNAGLTYPASEAATARQALLLALTLALVAGARRSSRCLEG